MKYRLITVDRATGQVVHRARLSELDPWKLIMMADSLTSKDSMFSYRVEDEDGKTMEAQADET